MVTQEDVVKSMAKRGLETMMEDKWDELPVNSIERALWIEVASNMLNELRRLYEISRK